MSRGRKKSPRSQASIADALGISAGVLSMIRRGYTPARMTKQEVARVCSAIQALHTNPTMPLSDLPTQGDYTMLLSHQKLTDATRKHFSLFRDPFALEVADIGSVFLSRPIRYVREAMTTTATHGGILAVVGESGAGKTILKKALIDRLEADNAQVIVVEPYVLAMEENDQKGKTLKSAAIAESIIRAVNPSASVRRSAEARFAQLHQTLKESRKAGNRHVLIIEEAHGMPTATLKHLKRFYEIEDGFKKLLSIILIGQPELRQKLSEKNLEVREVVQRCEIVELPPLDAELGNYLAFKCQNVGANVGKLIDDDAIEAIREKLTYTRKVRTAKTISTAMDSLLYPLAVGNVMSLALNTAATIGAEKVTAEIIQSL